MGLKDSFVLWDLDKILAVAGALLSILLIAQGGTSGGLLYLLLGILTFISCLLWLVVRKSHTFEFHLSESRQLTHFWMICFFGLYTLSVLSVYFRPEFYERPLLYFIITALMAGIISCEVLISDRQYVGLILIQILLLGVSVAWSQLLIFPSLLGTDPWYHSAITGQIIEEGVIPEGYAYSKLPLFHLMITATSHMASLPYKFAAMVSVSLGQIICNAVFVFIIANYVFKNYRIGLLAALLVIIANHHIFMSYSSIPNALAAVFIPIAIYLLLFKLKERSRLISATLLTVTLFPIILTHTITAMCMAILLFVLWGAPAYFRFFYGEKISSIPLLVPISFTTAMLMWWTFASDSIGTLVDLFKSGFSTDFFVKTPDELLNYATVVPASEQLFNNFGIYLFFAFSLIGIFYMISKEGGNSAFAMAWVGITPLLIGFISLISGSTVIEHRWWYFAQILLSIPLAVAILTIGKWKSKKLLHLHIFVVGFVVILSLTMLMSPPASADITIFSPNSHMRYSPTESELELITTLTEKWDGSIKTDRYFAGSQQFQHPQISTFCQNLYANDLLNLRDYIVVTREATIGRPFKIFSAIYKLDYDLNVKMNELGFSRIYDSNAGSGYWI